jgi:RNA polymerase sigma factor (sigma-70 family)
LTISELRAVRDAHIQIQSLTERIARLRSALESCATKPLTRMPKGRSAPRDKLGEDIARLLELEERRRKQIIDLEIRLEAVEKWIDSLPPQQATVVRLYYVNGLTWRQIGRKLNYHPDTCRKIRDAAIRGICESHPFSPASSVVL